MSNLTAPPFELNIELQVTRYFIQKLVLDTFVNITGGNMQQVITYGDQYSTARFMADAYQDIFIYVDQFGDTLLKDDLNLIARRIEEVVRFYFVGKETTNQPESQILRKKILSIISTICPDFEYSREDLYEG